MGQRATLRRSLGFRDLFLFYVSATFSLRWMATAAAAGPSGLVVWVIAALALFVPLVFSVLELSSRYPHEGGLYVWSREAFGPFAGFMTGWTYWTSNLPYFPGLLYFAAGNILFAGGSSWQALSTSSSYFIVVSLVGLAFAVAVNVVGVDIGKWLTNVGGISTWVPTVVLILLGLVSWWRFGSATHMNAASFIPSTGLKDVIFWSTVAFAFGGVESASTMAEEIEDPKRNVPRAILAAGFAMTALYLLGTFSILLVIPHEQISGLQGIMQAIQTMTTRAGAPWLVPVLALLVTLSAIGGVGTWFAATARIPFVAGLDNFLPTAFGTLHPKWRTPHVALLTQAALAAGFVVLGQAGTSVRGAYEVLVSMSVIAYFIPYLFLFASMIKLQAQPVGPDVMCTPGGAPVARFLGALGFFTTAVSIVLACVPADDDPNPTLAVVKIVGLSVLLVAAGALLYASGRRRAARAKGIHA